MARVKTTPRKKTGSQGVPRHQLAIRGDGASSSRNPNPDSQLEIARLTSEIERLKHNLHFWKQCQNESLEKETEVRARVRELELYVTHLEQYNTILHEEVHRLHDLMNPNHQPQAVEDDVGAVVVPGGEDNEKEDPAENEPMMESGDEASHVTGASVQENEDGVIVTSDDDEE
jgi:uncharacterized small protein (DUF1192 family)